MESTVRYPGLSGLLLLSRKLIWKDDKMRVTNPSKVSSPLKSSISYEKKKEEKPLDRRYFLYYLRLDKLEGWGLNYLFRTII